MRAPSALLPASVALFVWTTDLGQFHVEGPFPVFVLAVLGLVALRVLPVLLVAGR